MLVASTVLSSKYCHLVKFYGQICRLPKADAFECGVDISSGFVTGGQDAKRGQFPFAALLGYEDQKKTSETGIIYLCGATLINR